MLLMFRLHFDIFALKLSQFKVKPVVSSMVLIGHPVLTFNSQIKVVILLTVNHTILMSSENLVLDQLITPKLIFFFILITYLVDIILIL